MLSGSLPRVAQRGPLPNGRLGGARLARGRRAQRLRRPPAALAARELCERRRLARRDGGRARRVGPEDGEPLREVSELPPGCPATSPPVHLPT